MPQRRAVDAFGLSELYSQLVREFADQMREREATYGRAGHSVREEIVRCIWFGGHLPSGGLKTDDGRRIEVLSPGWWNVEGGPDFVRAEFLLEGAGRTVGDVEVHTFASGWRRHGHHRQPAYGDVALHVVMWNDTGEDHVTADSGLVVPQLTLSHAVGDDLEELVEIIDQDAEEGAGDPPALRGKYCGESIRTGRMATEWIGRLLDAAGDHRLAARVAGVRELFENHPRERLLYERIAEALGFKNNRMPFLQLAGLLPPEILRGLVPPEADADERARIIEAAYFGVAGMLEGTDGPADDEETVRYVEGLRDVWRGLPPELGGTRLSRRHWSFAGTRPVNYPARRIAALARLYAEHLDAGLFNHFVRVAYTARPAPGRREDVALRNALLDVFERVRHPYWSFRYTFGGKRLRAAKALIGRERATSLVMDVLLPTLMAHARTEDDDALARRLEALWQGLPRRPDNAVTRRVCQAMFEGREQARKIVGSARRQQGLHQLYRDGCRGTEGCRQCVVHLAHRAGRTLRPA